MRTCVPIVLLLLILSSACGSGGADEDTTEVPNPFFTPFNFEVEGRDPCLTYIDGHSAGQRVRTLKIRNNMKAFPGDDVNEGVVVRLTCPPGLTLATPTAGWTISADERVIEGEIKFGEVLCVPLYFDNIQPGQPPTKLAVKLESYRHGSSPTPEDELTFDFHSRPGSIMNAALEMLDEAGLPVDEITTHDVEKSRYESSWRQSKRKSERVTDIVAHTRTAATLDAAYLASLASAFPAGAGSTAYTVLAKSPVPGLPGDWLFFTLLFDDWIPMAPPLDEYQFVFGAKLDTDDTNDYQAPPDFPGDTFRNTDIQYALGFKPSLGWILTVTEYENGVLQEVASAAWVAILENALMFAIPPGQFLPDSQPYFSAFRHDGTWGQLAPFDWSMDYVPMRGDEPDAPIGAPPSGPGSPEAQAFDGRWRLDEATDYCITIANGTVTSLSLDCTTPLALAESIPGQTVTPTLVQWEMRLTDGRRVVITQNVDTSVNMDTALDIFSSPSDTLGVRTFPDLVPLP